MAGAGGKKTCDGFALKREADRIEGAATIRLVAARRRLDRATRSTILRMESLRRDQGAFREQIVEDLAPTMARVTRVEDGGWKALEAAAFDPDRLAVAWQVGPAATPELFKDTMVGIAAGAALRQGAFAAARGFGVASTGIAIGELGGAAATNASLAWLGGGTLSAGGWGMAGGALALNALAVGPGVLFAGLAVAKHGEKRKTGALAYAAQVDEAIAREGIMRSDLKAIRLRAEEVAFWGGRVSARAAALSASINLRLDEVGDRGFADCDNALQDAMLVLGGLVGILNAVADLHVIDEAGELLSSGSDDPLRRAKAWGGGNGKE